VTEISGNSDIVPLLAIGSPMTTTVRYDPINGVLYSGQMEMTVGPYSFGDFFPPTALLDPLRHSLVFGIFGNGTIDGWQVVYPTDTALGRFDIGLSHLDHLTGGGIHGDVLSAVTTNTVPEPGTLGLLAIGAISILKHRRHGLRLKTAPAELAAAPLNCTRTAD
jgi:hypothetical protein